MSHRLPRQDKVRKWHPQVELVEKHISLNDNLELTLQSVYSKRRSKRPLLKYQITRLNQSSEQGYAATALHSPALSNYSTIIAGKLDPTPTLVQATHGYRSANNRSPNMPSSPLNDFCDVDISLPLVNRTMVQPSNNQALAELSSATMEIPRHSRNLSNKPIEVEALGFKFGSKQRRRDNAGSVNMSCLPKLPTPLDLSYNAKTETEKSFMASAKRQSIADERRKESRNRKKRVMMKIYERYNLIPKLPNSDEIREDELISTDELFRKMYLMLGTVSLKDKKIVIPTPKRRRAAHSKKCSTQTSDKGKMTQTPSLENTQPLASELGPSSTTIDPQKRGTYRRGVSHLSNELSQGSRPAHHVAETENAETVAESAHKTRRALSGDYAKLKPSRAEEKFELHVQKAEDSMIDGNKSKAILLKDSSKGKPEAKKTVLVTPPVKEQPEPESPSMKPSIVLPSAEEETKKKAMVKEMIAQMLRKKKEQKAAAVDTSSEQYKELISAINSKDPLVGIYQKGSSKTGTTLAGNKMVEYLKYCADEKVIPLPLNANIQNKTLILDSYKLSDGICRALGKFLPALVGVEKVRLANNGISDEGMQNILIGIRESGTVRKLECCANPVGEAAVYELANILSKSSQEPFRELELNGVRISGLHLNSTLEMMSNNCFLNKLVLARLAFDEISIDFLAKIARKAKNLYHFSISGGEILASHVVQILKALVRNRILEYVDLSWLPLGSQGEMLVTEVKQEISELLCGLIVKDRQLIHLDLSYSRLTDTQIAEIAEAVKKSNSILCVHLSGNSISDKGRKQLAEELHAESLKIGKLEDEMDLLSVADNKETGAAVPGSAAGTHGAPKSRSSAKPGEGVEKYGKLTKDEPLIIWRLRSRNEVFLVDSTWISCSQCFICSKWRYTVFFYDPEIARKKFLPIKSPPSKPTFRSCGQLRA